MLQKVTAIAAACLATVSVASAPDPYTKYNSLHPIPAVDIEENPLTEVGVYSRGKKVTLVTNVASF
jgi:hypothetical protein